MTLDEIMRQYPNLYEYAKNANLAPNDIEKLVFSGGPICLLLNDMARKITQYEYTIQNLRTTLNNQRMHVSSWSSDNSKWQF